MKNWFVSVIMVLAGMSINAQTWQNLNYNEEQYGLESNPLRGYATMWNVHTSDPKDPNYVPYSIQGRLFKFNDILIGLNPTNGQYVYDWTLIDTFIQEQGDLGKHVYLQVNIDPVQNATLDLPQFIMDSLAIPNSVTGLNNLVYTNNVVIPNWNHPILLNSIYDFVQEFGSRYNSDPRVFLVHMGLYGMWGEWHIYPYEQTYPHLEMTQANKDSLATLFETYFPDKQILARYPESFTDPSKFGYSDGLFFEESVGQPSWYFQNILNNHGAGENWKSHPIGGEVSPILQDTLFHDFPNVSGQNVYFPEDSSYRHIQRGVPTLKSLHTTWLFDHYLFADPSQTGITVRERNNAKRLQKALGYRFFAKLFRISGENGYPKLQLKIQNKGTAPIYENWDVEFGVIDENETFHLLKTQKWDLHTILPSSNTPTRSILSDSSIADGNYTVLIRIVNPLEVYSDKAPPLRFANQTQDMHKKGWLTIADITVLNGQVVSTDQNIVASPYGGENRAIPGIIEGEYYDNGGLGVSFNDDSLRVGNSKYSFRVYDEVDIVRKPVASNNFAVGYTNDGEWLNYSVDVIESRYYDITLNYFCAAAPGDLQVSLDGNTIATFTGIQTFSNWKTQGSITVSNVYIDEGIDKTLKLTYVNGGKFDIDNVIFTPVQHIQDGVYTLRSVSGGFLKATGMTSPINSSISTAGDSTNWNIIHLGDDIYRMESVMFNNQRMEIPNGNCGAGFPLATTWYTGGEDHLKWKASMHNGKLIFEPLHCLGNAVDVQINNPTSVQIQTKDLNNNDQLFQLLPPASNASTLGIEGTYNANSEIAVYPNPVENELNIYVPEANEEETRIIILDITGKILYTSTVLNQHEKLNANILGDVNFFFVQIKNRRRTETFKVVKSN